MTVWIWILPANAAALTAAWRVHRRGRLNTTSEFLGAVVYGFAVGCVIILVQFLFVHVWVNTWGSA